MRVLVIEDRDQQVGPAVEALREADHEVTACHEPGDAGLDCNGMPGRHGCPLADGSIDVALLGGPAPIDAGSAGAGCARRHRVPVVLVGSPAGTELPSWADAVVDVAAPDLVDQIDAVGRTGRAPLIAAAESTARAVLDRSEWGHVGIVGDVVREHRRLSVTVAVDAPLDARTRDTLAVRVTSAVRALDPYSPSVDVHVVCPE